MIFPTFSSSLALSICCCLSLLPTCSPPRLSPSTDPPTDPCSFPLSLLSWWASQEAVHAFAERNLLFLPFPFPFQSPVHSWNRGALHADERELPFFFLSAHSEKRGGGRGRKRVEPDGRVKVCGEWRQQLSAEIIRFHLIGIQPMQQEDSRCFFCRLNTFQM